MCSAVLCDRQLRPRPSVLQHSRLQQRHITRHRKLRQPPRRSGRSCKHALTRCVQVEQHAMHGGGAGLPGMAAGAPIIADT